MFLLVQSGLNSILRGIRSLCILAFSLLIASIIKSRVLSFSSSLQNRLQEMGISRFNSTRLLLQVTSSGTRIFPSTILIFSLSFISANSSSVFLKTMKRTFSFSISQLEISFMYIFPLENYRISILSMLPDRVISPWKLIPLTKAFSTRGSWHRIGTTKRSSKNLNAICIINIYKQIQFKSEFNAFHLNFNFIKIPLIQIKLHTWSFLLANLALSIIVTYKCSYLLFIRLSESISSFLAIQPLVHLFLTDLKPYFSFFPYFSHLLAPWKHAKCNPFYFQGAINQLYRWIGFTFSLNIYLVWIQSSMAVLSASQQTGRTAYLGIAFMIMFTAFNSLQNIVSKLYDEYGYTNLGTASIILLYFVYGAFTFFAPFIIRTLGFKKSMFISSLGYGIFEGAGMIIALNQNMPQAIGWILVMLGAVFCGASASVIWVAQGSYISEISDQESRTKLFGLFWGIMMSSQIFGNILTTFVLGVIGNTVYLIVLTILGFGSAFLFLLLPDVEANYTDTLSLKNQAKKIFDLIKNPDYKYLTLYYYFPGIAIGFYATFLSKLIGLAVPQDMNQSNADYTLRLDNRIGYVFIALGVSQACFGIFMNRFGERFCKFKLAISGTILVQFAGFMSLLCYMFESYALCFVISFLWGGCDTFIQTNLGAVISALFPGKVESFSVYRIFFALGVVTTVILNLALDGQPEWIFLVIVMAFQMFYSLVSIKVMELKGRVKTSLLDREEST